MRYQYPITIHHLYISPGHNYFTHTYDAPGNHPITNCNTITIEAGQGIVGDRFYGRGATFDGHVTFFSWEVFQLLQAEHSPPPISSPIALRRNIIIEGVPLNQLIGQEFMVDTLRFRGSKHCAPCQWMNIAVTQGALTLLKGRGGLRAQALTTGKLQRGTALLITTIPLDLEQITARLPRPNLP